MRAETFDCTVPSSREAREKPSASYTATKYRRSLTSIPSPHYLLFSSDDQQGQSSAKARAQIGVRRDAALHPCPGPVLNLGRKPHCGAPAPASSCCDASRPPAHCLASHRVRRLYFPPGSAPESIRPRGGTNNVHAM